MRIQESRTRSIYKAIHDVSFTIADERPWIGFAAVDLVHDYQTQSRSQRQRHSFIHFTNQKRRDIEALHGLDTPEIIDSARRLHDTLPRADRKRKHESAVSVRDSYHALSTWWHIRTLLSHRDTRIAGRQLARLTGQATPEVVHRIEASVLARYPVSLAISKPAVALGLATPFLRDIPESVRDGAGFWVLAALVAALGWAKSEQDIANHKLGAPYITIETQVAHDVMHRPLRASSYWVHGVWLAPFLVPAVLSHAFHGTDTLGVLLAQSIIYAGDIMLDAALSMPARIKKRIRG